MESTIVCDKITKEFKDNIALSNIEFEIHKGDCVALLGQNGAGKTTLLNIMLHKMKPTSGKLINNYKRSETGYLTQLTKFPDDIKVKEIIKFVSKFSASPFNDKQLDDVLHFNDVKMNQITSNLSGGQQRLLDFCLTILNNPKLLVVDEPTGGMDTSTRKHFWNIMSKLKQQGTTIVFTSHYIEEVNYISDRVLLLNKGHLIANDTPFHLRALNKRKTLTFDKDIYYKYLSDFNNIEITLSNVIKVINNGDTILWNFDDSKTKIVLNEIEQHEIDLSSIELSNASLLDTVFNDKLANKKGEK